MDFLCSIYRHCLLHKGREQVTAESGIEVEIARGFFSKAKATPDEKQKSDLANESNDG